MDDSLKSKLDTAETVYRLMLVGILVAIGMIAYSLVLTFS